MQQLQKGGARKQSLSFGLTYRYNDDVLSLNNATLSDHIDLIYHKELEIKDTTEAPNFANYFDLHLEWINIISYRLRYMYMIKVTT